VRAKGEEDVIRWKFWLQYSIKRLREKVEKAMNQVGEAARK